MICMVSAHDDIVNHHILYCLGTIWHLKTPMHFLLSYGTRAEAMLVNKWLVYCIGVCVSSHALKQPTDSPSEGT